MIKALEKAQKPIWLSDLHRVYGLPYATFYGTKRNPASQALREMIRDKEIIDLAPRYALKNSLKPRRRICLPSHTSIAKNCRTYYEVQLSEKIDKLSAQIEYFKTKLKNHGIVL